LPEEILAMDAGAIRYLEILRRGRRDDGDAE
jgi:hypothetical protein